VNQASPGDLSLTANVPGFRHSVFVTAVVTRIHTQSQSSSKCSQKPNYDGLAPLFPPAPLFFRARRRIIYRAAFPIALVVDRARLAIVIQ
jgi:hypothetical protein